MIDEIQNVVDSNKLDIDELYDVVDINKANKFKRKITSTFDEIKNVDNKIDNSYIEFLAKMYFNKKRITNKDIMLFLIMLEYLKLAIKTNDLELFNEIVRIAYKHAEKECKKELGQVKKVRPVSVLDLWLMSMPNHLGNIWSDYIQNEINYNANQLFKQIMIDISQNNDIDLNNDIYINIFNKQQKAHFNINDDKYSGGVEAQTDYLVNKTILEVGKDYGMQKCRFIAEMDKRTTDMCETLNNQIFNLNDWNTYQRYSAGDEKIVTYKTFGLVLGDNLPPISNHFHYCRSTITYNLDGIEEKDYIEATKNWLSKSAVNRNAKVIIPKKNDIFNYKGINYVIDGKNVEIDYSIQEVNVANWLSKKINKKIEMIPKINYPFGTKTPDYKIGKNYFDLKTINGASRQALYHSIYGKETQSINFIFDVTNSKLEIIDFKEQVNKLYNREDTNWVNKIIIKQDDYISIFERK